MLIVLIAVLVRIWGARRKIFKGFELLSRLRNSALAKAVRARTDRCALPPAAKTDTALVPVRKMDAMSLTYTPIPRPDVMQSKVPDSSREPSDSAIGLELMRLRAATSNLEGIVGHMLARLEPVLRDPEPPPPEAGSTLEKDSNTPLGRELRDLSNRILAAARLLDLTEVRLELPPTES